MISKKCCLSLTLLLFMALSHLAQAEIEFSCPCIYQSSSPTSASIRAGVTNFGSEASGAIRIIPWVEAENGNAFALGEVFLISLEEGANYDNSNLLTHGFEIPGIEDNYKIYADLYEFLDEEWVWQDRTRFTPEIYLEPIGGGGGYLYLDGTATLSFVSESIVTIGLPSIKNGSQSETTDNLIIRLGSFPTEALLGQSYSYYLETDHELSLALGPSEESAAQTILMAYAPIQEDEYVYLMVMSADDDSLYLWQNVSAPAPFQHRDFLVNSIDTLKDTDADGVSDFNESLMETNPTDASSKPGTSVLDVMALYTPGVADLYSGDPETRIVHVLEYGNLALESSGVDARFRLVHLEEILYSEQVSGENALDAMQAEEGIFSGLDARRVAAGADLAVLFRPYNDDDNLCGIAAISDIGREGDFEDVLRSDMLSHTYIDCHSSVTAHEFGHNMGLGHDRLESSNTGTFRWSRGHGVDGEFVTIMAYESGYSWAPTLRYFSSPNTQCRGETGDTYSCGVTRTDTEEGADAALSIDTVRFQVANWSPDPPDTDADGLINFKDVDDDNDGVFDDVDALPLDPTESIDTDGDGIGNNADTDDDNDGLSDAFEISVGLDPLDATDVTGSPREILWRHAENGQNILWSMETQHRVARNALNTVADERWRVVGMADFTGDGQDEVFFRHDNGQNRIWTIVDGKRTSSDAITSAHKDWFVAALGDFDADGDADLMWRNRETGANRYWEMDGLIRLSSLAVRSVHLDWKVAGSGDFDGDGRNDLFWRHSKTGANVIWLMESEEIATRGQLTAVPIAWEVSGIGDFDADGMDDIFWQYPTTGANSIWLLYGAERKSRHSLSRTSVGWRAFGVLDMNGDSFADILLRHNVYGWNRLWLMNRSTRTHNLEVRTVSDPNWEPVAVGNTP